jgi:hypothetical protein
MAGDLEILGVAEPEVQGQVAAVVKDDRISGLRMNGLRHCTPGDDVACI